jgi:hypothetical protein
MQSSVIADFKYNAKNELLRVTFVSGMVYDYKNVPENVVAEMKTAASKGTYLNRCIKGKFMFKKIK